MRVLLSIALLQIISCKIQAQNYYVQVTGNIQTQVADIAASTLFHGSKLITYNTVQSNGDEDLHLLNLDYSNIVNMSSQFHLANYKLVAKKILPKGHFILAEKIDISSPQNVKPIIIEINSSNGTTITVQEMPALPTPYSYLSVYDLAEDVVTNELRILCTATDGTNTHIFELHYNKSLYQCTFTRYTPQVSFSDYGYLGYIKHYHYSSELMGEVAFYASPMNGGVRKGFVFFKNFSLPYSAEVYSYGTGVKGFMVNGASENNCGYNVITMAFNKGDSKDICLQQKCNGLATQNWRRFYRPLNNASVYFGYGRGGHGIKYGSGDDEAPDYFIGTSEDDLLVRKIVIVRYSNSNGNLDACPQFNFTNTNNKTSWPNFTADPGNPYYFIVDRYNPVNGFKMAEADGYDDEPNCTETLKFEEVNGSLTEETVQVDIINYPSSNCTALLPTRTSTSVTIISECDIEQRTQHVIVSRKPLK